MKQFLIFLLLFSIKNFSQDISFVPVTTSTTGTLNSEMIFYIDITNTSQDTQIVFIKRTENELPEGWTSSLCFFSCFAPFIDSVATIPDPFGSEPLHPGELRRMSLYVYSSSTPGTGYVTLQAGTFNNPNDRITVNFQATANATSINDKIFPEEFYLFNNYPNPFNPSTTIKFQIPAIGNQLEYAHTTLKVYDLIGNEVALLLNEQKSPGIYEVKWNADNLSSGVYFVQLKAGGIVVTRKVLLSK